jgi:hypothetical protein
MQSVLFPRPEMGAFLSQLEVCKLEFVLPVPTFKTVDGREISLPYKLATDTMNRTAPSGCVRPAISSPRRRARSRPRLSHSVRASAHQGVSSSLNQVMPIAGQMPTMAGLCLMPLISAVPIQARLGDPR